MDAQGDRPAPYWKCIVAAAPEAFVGLQFLLVALKKPPLVEASRHGLTTVMQAEFLVIHSMAFLGLVALWKPRDAPERRARALVFWGLFGLYCLAAASRGLGHAALFAGLTFVTYLGLFLNWRSESALIQLGARWAVGTALFLAAIIAFGTPKNVGEWAGRSSVIAAGAAYFLGLAALELSGLFLRVVPRNAARLAAWLRSGKRRGA